jgi:hypothetical protein
VQWASEDSESNNPSMDDCSLIGIHGLPIELVTAASSHLVSHKAAAVAKQIRRKSNIPPIMFAFGLSGTEVVCSHQ